MALLRCIVNHSGQFGIFVDMSQDTNFSHGRQAEDVAAAYLKQCKYKIIEMNWKTPRCEIDIIAKKNQCIYFFEVKFRKNSLQGDGFDYITPRKLQQMVYAAETWLAFHEWGGSMQVGAIEVSGKDYTVSGFIDSLILD
jgi:putative endonuclease